jgi:hypothetical protein
MLINFFRTTPVLMEPFFPVSTQVNTTVTFKFVVSSTPFMSLWLGPDGGVDTWAGFLTERSELMDSMQFVPNLIVLSGVCITHLHSLLVNKSLFSHFSFFRP